MTLTDKSLAEPLVSLSIAPPAHGRFFPGDELTAQCQIDAIESDDVLAVEVSVLWYTEGKGDEDMAVHFFQRRVPTDVANGDLRTWHEFRTRLPNSPLSYSGIIVKVRWCVRVRVFSRRGREVVAESPFELGNLPPATILEPVVAPAAKTSARGESADNATGSF